MPVPIKALNRETKQAIFTLEDVSNRPQSGRRRAGSYNEGSLEVRKKLPGPTSDLARLELRAEAEGVSWHLVQACLSQVGSWHGNPFYWSPWLRAPRRGTSLAPI